MDPVYPDTSITFFVEDTDPDTIKRFVKINKTDSELIQRICNEGFAPNVSLRKCPKFLPSLLGWALLKNELEFRCDWSDINTDDVIALIYWREIDEESFTQAKAYFEDLFGLKTLRDKVILERCQEKFKVIKAPFLGGSEIKRDDGDELPDGRKIIAVVEGGEHENLVNKRLMELKQREFHERPLEDSKGEDIKKQKVDCY